MNRNRLHFTSAGLPALLCLMVACSRMTGPPALPVQDLPIPAGDSVQFGGVTVRAIALQDSRCPSDVQCITGGDVVMILGFSGVGPARTDTLRFYAAPKTSTYGGILFTPMTVLPYPKTSDAGTPKVLTLHAMDASYGPAPNDTRSPSP